MNYLKPLGVRLEERSIPEPNSGCFLWMGALDRKGYAVLTKGNRGKQFAHRAAYELARGPIPDELVIDHKCRIKCCVNPDHLEVVTSRENTFRHFGSTSEQCSRGHEFTTANTYITPRGARQCRACNRIAVAALRGRQQS